MRTKVVKENCKNLITPMLINLWVIQKEVKLNLPMVGI